MKLSSLWEQFSSLPGPLRRVLELRSLAAVVSSFLAVIVLFFVSGIQLAIPPLLTMVYCLFSASALFADCISGNCIRLQGPCSAVVKAALRRRPRAIYVMIEDKVILIRLSAPVPVVNVGDNVTLYLSGQQPVYERDGVQVIPKYFALNVIPYQSIVETSET